MRLDINLRVLSFVLAISCVPGCLVNGEEALDGRIFDGISDANPAGPILNGLQTNGHSIDGVSFHSASIAGMPVQLSLPAGELVATSSTSNSMGGANLKGALLKGFKANNTPVSLRIDNVTATADPEIFEYTVAAWDGSAWANPCGTKDGLPVRALALGGRWDQSSGTATGGDHIDDPNVFTFACKTAVTAKCVGMGYAPWRSITECSESGCQTISMRNMHQACTRMMRADYCGDGTGHTQNGTMINVWDNFEIQTPDTALMVNWTDEAEWSPSGAACIQQVRWSGAAEAYIANNCPERWVSVDFDCFSSQSTFFTSEGYSTPISQRSLLRNQFTHDAP